MTWIEQFAELKTRSVAARQGEAARSKPVVPVDGLAGIPPDATPAEAYRLPVGVVRVAEQTTRDGRPYRFLTVEDAAGVRFTVVCWDGQWTKLGGVAEGEAVTLTVRVPAGGFESFTLA